MAQGLLRVAGQTALGQKVGQLDQAHRDVARGLRRLGVGRQQTFADLEAALVMAQGLLRVAQMAVFDECIANKNPSCRPRVELVRLRRQSQHALG